MRASSILALLMLAVPADAQQWTPLSSFPGTARDDAATFTIGTDVFVGTGMEVGWALTQDWWRYAATSAQWQQIAPLPATPREHAAAWSINGTGFVFGGFGNGGVYLNDLWMYDPQLDIWSARSPLPGPGRHSCAAFTIGTRAFVILGRYGPGSALTNETWGYDMDNDTWTQLASYPGESRLLSAAFSNGTYGFVVAGQDTGSLGVNDVFMYDPGTNGWSAGSTPSWDGRFGACGCYGASHAFLLGGTHAYSTCCMDAAWSYDPGADEWSALPDLPNGDRKGAICTFIPSVGLFFGTGIQGDSLRRSDCWLLSVDLGMHDNDLNTAAIFPNPSSSTLHLSVPSPGPSSVTITDARGSVVLKADLLLPATIDVGDRGRGLYLIRITDQHGYTTCLRWVHD